MAFKGRPRTGGHIPQARSGPFGHAPHPPTNGKNGARRATDTRSPHPVDLRGEMGALGARLALFGITTFSIIVDLVFVGLWITLHVQAHHIFKKLGDLEGIGSTTAAILEISFTGATLAIVLSYVAHDVLISVARHWKGGLGGRTKPGR